MKASALQDWLSSQTKVLEKACGGNSVFGLRLISDMLAAKEDASVTDICKVVNKVAKCGGDGDRVETTAELLSLIVEGACKFAKAADVKDLKRFAASIESKKNEHIEAFALQATKALATQPAPVPTLAGLSEEDMHTYLKKLEEALGDGQGFRAVYDQLSHDARLRAPDAKKLAKAFAGKPGRGKADSLGRIYERHESLMSAGAKAKAIGGRLAG